MLMKILEYFEELINVKSQGKAIVICVVMKESVESI